MQKLEPQRLSSFFNCQRTRATRVRGFVNFRVEDDGDCRQAKSLAVGYLGNSRRQIPLTRGRCPRDASATVGGAGDAGLLVVSKWRRSSIAGLLGHERRMCDGSNISGSGERNDSESDEVDVRGCSNCLCGECTDAANNPVPTSTGTVGADEDGRVAARVSS